MKTPAPQKIVVILNPLVRCLLLAGGLAAAGPGSAAVIQKADNAINLTDPTSWVGGGVPTSGDVALWDSTITTANTTLLNGDTNFLGLSIANPIGAVTISAGNTLTIGASGVDMTSALQDLNLQCGVTLGAAQILNVAAGRMLNVSGAISGTNGLTKGGDGILALGTANTYTNGSVINGGVVRVDALGATFGVNAIGHTITFNGGAISNNWGAGNQLALNNSLVVPTGQTGTIYMGNRVRLASNGNAASITGGGTLNFVCGSTVTRDDIGSAAGAFTGTVNFTGTGPIRFFINGGAFSGFSNATVNVNAPLDFQFNDNTPGNFFAYGALSATDPGFTMGNTSAGGAPRFVLGQLNTDTTFAGAMVGGAQLTKVGTGTMTFTGNNRHTGTNGIITGKMVGVTGGSFSNVTSIATSTNATFGLLVGPAGNRWVGTNMIFANGSTLELNFAGSTPSLTTAPLLVQGNVSLSNTVAVKILGGNWAVGAYPLVKYSTITNGGGFAALNLTTLPPRVNAVLSNDTVNSSIDLVVTSTTEPLKWATGNGVWDVNTTPNWLDAALASTTYQQSNGFGDTVQFEDTQSVGTPITVSLNTAATPASVTVNSAKTFTISGSGSISGFASLTKSGSGTLTVGTTNTFTGGANLNGGVLNFSILANLGGAGSPIALGGGTLQFGSGNTTDISVRTVTLNAAGGILDTAGNNVTLANGIGNGGAGGLTKTGLGRLTLSRANSYAGNTVVSQGTLALAAGAGVSNSVSIVVSNGAILDVTAAGLALNGTVSQTLGGAGSIVGNVTSGAGSSVLPGTSPGTLTFSNDLTMVGGTLAMDVSTNVADRDLIIVNGALTLTSGNLQLVPSTLLTNGTYRMLQTPGGISGSVGTLLLLGFAQPGQIAFLSDAVAGEIDLIVATGGTNNLVWQGDGGGNLWDVGSSADWLNGANPSVFNQGDGVIFDATGSANPTAGLAAAIYPSNITVSANSDYTLQDGSGSGTGKLIGPTRISKSGSGKLTLLTVNNNTGPTVITGGTVQLGNGSATGSLGNGNVTNNGALVFAQPDDRSVNGLITGPGPVVQQGAAILTYAKDNNYSGGTTISSGTLQVGAGGASGLPGSGPVTNAGTLIFNRSGAFTIANGIVGTGTPNPAALVKLGTGTMTLGGVNTYEGNTYVSNGILKLAASEVIPDGGATTGWLILDGGPATAGTFDLNGFNETVNALQGLGGAVLGQVVNNSGTATNTLTVNAAVNSTFAGLIRDNTGSGGKIGLIKDGPAQLTLTGNSTYSGGTIVKAGTLGIGTGGQAGTAQIVLSNGVTLTMTANGVSVFPGNNIITGPGATANFSTANPANGLGGNFISGDAFSTNAIIGAISCSTANIRQFSNFFGTVLIQDGFSLRFSSTTLSVNGGDNTTFVVGNASTLNTRNGTGVAAGNGIYLGAVIGTGTIGAGGAAAGTSVYVIGGKGTDCTFDGTISGTTPNSTALIKIGAGTLTLDGALSYDSFTTVSNGVLTLAGSAVLDASQNISVKAGAALFLDPAGATAGILNLGNSVFQTLSGSGTIRGSLAAGANSMLSPGDFIGILTVTNIATLGGTNFMELNRTNTPASDRLVATSIAYGGELSVTNIGPALRSGDTFQLFSGPLSGSFGATNLPALTPCLSWNTSTLNTAGTISVAGSICPPTLTSLVVNRTNLQLSWESDFAGTGWLLQAQTNAITVGLRTNWVNVTGSGATNQVTFPINSTNGAVFYRLTYQ